MEKTLGLKQNPFDPEFEELGKRTGEPLEVHRHPYLADYICWDMADLERSRKTISYLLFEDDGPATPPKRQIIFVVSGVVGSGRTTLASHILATARAAPAPVGLVWGEVFSTGFPAIGPTPAATVVEQRLSALRDKIVADCGGGPANISVLVENLPNTQLPLLVELYKSLGQFFRLFVVTMQEDELKALDLDAWGPRIELVECPKTTPIDARALIAHRLTRVKPAIPTCDGDLALFPFGESAGGKAVGPTGAKPLRSVAAWLMRAIENKHVELRDREPLVPAILAGPDELRTRLIS